jgi:hypothetical protein
MEPETLEHFLLDCNVLAETREPYISELNVLIKECHPCMLFLLVFNAKHNLRVTCSTVYKVFKQLQSQPQHTVLGYRILRKLSINVLVVLHSF